VKYGQHKGTIHFLIFQLAVQGVEADSYLAKQPGFCISVTGGRGNFHYPTYLNKLSSLAMTFTLGVHC